MPKANAIVGTIEALDDEPVVTPADAVTEMASGARVRTVRVAGQQPAYLSASGDFTPLHNDILNLLKQTGRPVYLQVSDRSVIQDISIPIVGRVVRLRGERDGTLRVGLDTSPRRLSVMPADIDFARKADLLRRSRDSGITLAVTDSLEDDDVVDVDEAPASASAFAPAFRAVRTVRASRDAVHAAVSTLTSSRVQKLFRTIDVQECTLPSPADECIPFNYPDDGCFARAHMVYELLREQGIEAGKVWIYGDLSADTVNHPQCHIGWTWHVAPFLRKAGEGPSSVRVLDPSLFDTEVSLTDWIAKLGDPGAQYFFTSGDVFMRSPSGEQRDENTFGISPGSTETKDFLRIYRLKLRKRTPPPPYRHCTV